MFKYYYTVPPSIDGKEIEFVPKEENRVQDVDHPWELGSHYVIRTVTMTQTGVVVAVYPQEIVMKDAAWVADTGRFHDFLKGKSPSEVEPFTDNVIVGRGSIVDAQKVAFAPLRTQA